MTILGRWKLVISVNGGLQAFDVAPVPLDSLPAPCASVHVKLPED